MGSERTSVALDVHARSVVAAAIDGVTGEVFRARLTPDYGQVVRSPGLLAAERGVIRKLAMSHNGFATRSHPST